MCICASHLQFHRFFYYFPGSCFTHQYKNSTQFRLYASLIASQNTKSQERDTFKAIFTATKEFQISDRTNNLDQLITSGLYNFNVGMNNSAPGNGYGACLVFRGGDPNLYSAWWIIQIAFTTVLHIYIRQSSDTGNSWTSWSEIN